MNSPISQEEAIELVRGPYGDAVLKSVAKCAAPVFWENQGEGDAAGITNGTIFLADYGEGCFAVTANHVYEGFLRAKTESPELVGWIAPEAFEAGPRESLPFDLEGHLIDRLEDADIATFRITDEEARNIGTSITTTWPPIVPEVGKAVVFTGYPGIERLELGPMELSFAPFPALTIATNVNERRISCQFEREYLAQAPGFNEPPANMETGGMSGGPLFTVIEQHGISRWHLGAVVTTGNATFEIVSASPADCIMKDGRLRR